MVKGDQFYRPKDIQRLEKWIILPWKCHANAGIHSDSLDPWVSIWGHNMRLIRDFDCFSEKLFAKPFFWFLF